MGVIRYRFKQAAAYTPGRTRPISSIILHSTDGHEAGDVATLTGPKVSVHWYVTKDGRYWHFVADADTAYHAGKVDLPQHSNSGSIGIEQEHMDGSEAWPDTLVQATANLVEALRQKHGADLPVLSHAAVATPAGRKVDPVAFPWEELSGYVKVASEQTWTFEEVEPA